MAAGGTVIERPFSIPRDDGTTIRGDLRLLEGETPVGAIVVAHGFKGFKDWGFFPYLCQRLAEDGHAVVSFNFSLNGIGDDPTEFTELENFAQNTFSRDIDEILIVLEQVRSGGILAVPPTRLGLFGHSRGGGEVLIAARDDECLDALVTWAGLATFERWSDEVRKEWAEKGRIHVLNARTGQQMPLDHTLLDDFKANRERLDIEVAAATLKELSWLIVHGEEDASVPISDADRLVAANPRVEVERIPSAGHAFEALHPFQGSTPELERAIGATSRHFGLHLLPEKTPTD